MGKEKSTSPTVLNRKAKHEYHFLESVEAGVCLEGHEVKSIREGRVTLADSYVRILGEEAFIINMNISTYSKIQGTVKVDPTRSRKLLMKKHEILSFLGKTTGKGLTLVPTKLYFKRGFVKIEVALAKGKKEYDKRETLKRRIHDREAQQAIKNHGRS